MCRYRDREIQIAGRHVHKSKFGFESSADLHEELPELRKQIRVVFAEQLSDYFRH